MTHTVCTDCNQPIESGMVMRSISSQLEPVPFHAACYRMHVPTPRVPERAEPPRPRMEDGAAVSVVCARSASPA